MESPQAVPDGMQGHRVSVHDRSPTNSQAKRVRTKGVFACDACRARRSKCDLIDHEGCHRCKQLRTSCSFSSKDLAPVTGGGSQGLSLPEHTATSMDPVTIPLIERMEQMERDMKRMQEGLRDRPSPVVMAPFDYTLDPGHSSYRTTLITSPEQSRMNAWSPAHSTIYPSIYANKQSLPSSGPARRDGKNKEERDEAWFKRTADPETFGRIDRGILGKEEKGLRDPISEGIISKRRAEEVYVL